MSKAAEQFAEKCKRWWDESDSNKDGTMSIQEMRTMIKKVASNVELSDADIADIFVDMDDDGDKKLSWDEFSDVFLKKDPKTIQENELKEGFKKMDANGNGFLTKEEIRAHYNDLGISISDEAFDNTCASADTDGDGKINFNEFVAVWKAGL